MVDEILSILRGIFTVVPFWMSFCSRGAEKTMLSQPMDILNLLMSKDCS